MKKQKTPTRSAKRTWSYKAGEKGRNRVRVFAWPKMGEGLWIDYRDGGQRIRKPLGHSDQERAKRQADSIAARSGAGTARPAGVITLQTLFDIYVEERTPEKGWSAQKFDRCTLPLLLRALGKDRHPESLNRRDWDGYIRRRRSGAIGHPKSSGQGVRARIIERELKLLRAVLKWAKDCDYIEGHVPLGGLKTPREDSPVRPSFTDAQCVALRKAAAKHSPAAERFVMLAWLTGHRSNAIRQLRWGEIDTERGTIRWRAASDKSGHEHRTPTHPELLKFLKGERVIAEEVWGSQLGKAWVFPAEKDETKPMPRDTSQKLWQALAKAAEIPRGEQYGWHSFRRAFANRLHRAGVAIRDAQDLGGWKNPKVLLDTYLLSDEEAQRQALAKLASLPATGSDNGQ